MTSTTELVDALLGRVRRTPQQFVVDCITEQLPFERFARDTARAMADELLLRIVLDRADETAPIARPRGADPQADGDTATPALAPLGRSPVIQGLQLPIVRVDSSPLMLGGDPLCNRNAIPMIGSKPVDLIALARFAIECEELLPADIRKDAPRARYAGVQAALHRIALVVRVLHETQQERNGAA